MSPSRRQLNPVYGIAAFIIIEIIFFVVFAPLQYYFGMLGLALTELGLLACTLLAVKLTGQSFREVFPLRRPKFGQVLGTLVLWGGCFLSTMLATLVLMYFFPEGFLQASSDINSIFNTVPAPVQLLIVAVMPAVCEEAMHRGFIQHSFQSVRSDWVIILSMGLIFGIFHMDPYRFLPTAILGIGLSYVMQKTHNIFLPALFHFVNNFISVAPSLGTSVETTAESIDISGLLTSRPFILMSIGSYLMLGALAPILLLAGSHLLRKASGSLPQRTEGRVIAAVILTLTLSGLMFIAGFTIVFLSITALQL